MNRIDKRWIWIGLCATVILLQSILSPAIIEAYYSRGFFLFIRKVIDAVTGIIPFALVYILFFILLGGLFFRIWRFFKKEEIWYKKWGNALFSLVAFLAGAVFFFQFMWGFNYSRIPVEDQLQLTPKPLSLEALKEELDTTTILLNQLRANLTPTSDSAITTAFLPSDLENTMHATLVSVLQKNGFPTPGKVRGRLLAPKGILLRISTAGVYIPFTGEGHIDAGLHPLQIPFVMAHEMSHGYGFGDEGTCNFLAYLACIQSSDPFLQYVGTLSYWRYLASNYRRYEPEVYSDFFKNQVSIGIRNDLIAIYAEMDKYPDILPQMRDYAYNTYLKAQGIEEGIKNYSRILMLVKAWKESGREG